MAIRTALIETPTRNNNNSNNSINSSTIVESRRRQAVSAGRTVEIEVVDGSASGHSEVKRLVCDNVPSCCSRNIPTVCANRDAFAKFRAALGCNCCDSPRTGIMLRARKSRQTGLNFEPCKVDHTIKTD